jgi:hypothetical protein
VDASIEDSREEVQHNETAVKDKSPGTDKERERSKLWMVQRMVFILTTKGARECEGLYICLNKADSAMVME